MSKTSSPLIPRNYLRPFIFVTSLFALWGFANDLTNPLVAAFGRILEISTGKAALVQLAFYGGYFTMAVPAALFIMRYSYKVGVLIGLALYAVGALLFFPAAHYGVFAFFLIALYILTFGLAFLETTANPYILSMGDPVTATRRLNWAQSFNPIGSLTGMLVARNFILTLLQSDNQGPDGALIYPTLEPSAKAIVRDHDLLVIRNPYVALGAFVVFMFILILLTKMPKSKKEGGRLSFVAALKKLSESRNYWGGVVAQTFYVATQISCWTFIIHYAANIGLSYTTAQSYNMAAMVIFLTSRFICTYLLKYSNPGFLLMAFALGGVATSLGTVFVGGYFGLLCLVATSGFMSLMFPTIYGIALQGMGEEAKLGAAGLVMGIVGGALMPPLQGLIIDLDRVGPFPGVNFSFILPLFSFVVVALYGYYNRKKA